MELEARPVRRRPSRNLGLDIVRATEAAALAAGRWMGLGRPYEAHRAAAAAMRDALDTVEINGCVVVGEEGRMSRCAMPQSGQAVGTGYGPQVDIVVDPIDGRRLLARGHMGAIAVAAVAPQGAMWASAPAVYMEKIVVGPEVAPHLVPECMDAPAAWTLALVARAKGKQVSDLIVFVLDRPRHVDLIEEVRAAGARVMLCSDGDIAGALLAVMPGSGVDIVMGVGGLMEGLISVCALKAAQGGMLGRLAPQSDEERSAVQSAGLDVHQILTEAQLVASDAVFFAATGITDGPLLSGVSYTGNRATSHSIIMRGETQTRRVIRAEHLLDE
jgi:fructose-1,6-bisphosphatase II